MNSLVYSPARLRRPRLRWVRWVLASLLLLLFLLVGSFFAAGGAGLLSMFAKPSAPFDARKVPPAPNYARADAWLAFPGRNGMERSTPPGVAPIDEVHAPVDVFFIHPTTYTAHDIWNAPYDAPNDVARLNPPVLLGQLSVFNGCCRLYAPHYRQASLPGLKNEQAVALAYSDVAAAFRYFIAHESKGRPFIIASHSQGTGHAIELLQREILGTPLQARMVAAYLIGGYVPEDFSGIGLPLCGAPKQTGCIISWNTSKAGWSLPRKILIGHPTYWWQGIARDTEPKPAVCTNALSWRTNGGASAHNPGSLPFPKAPFPISATTLPALVPDLTGAACNGRMLEVSIPSSAPAGFSDELSRLLGSYHLNDYGIFYASLRRNAVVRTQAWQAAHS
jgi:hypothetical protein